MRRSNPTSSRRSSRGVLCLSAAATLLGVAFMIPAAAEAGDDVPALRAPIAVSLFGPSCPDESADRQAAPAWFLPEAAAPAAPGFARVRFDDRAPCVRKPLRITAEAAAVSDAAAQGSPRPVAIVYSDGYYTRAKIHKMASFATLPLFGVQAVIGQQMFNNPALATGARRSIHKWTGIGVVSLFGVNSVTGVWNLIEARKDPNGKTLRTIHGTLMLVADAGFAAATIARPTTSANGLAIFTQKENQHLAIAYGALAVATVGYVIMLFR